MSLKIIVFRCVRIIGRIFYRRRIWLISDRSTMAGDNGEAFFKYLKQKGVDAIFALSSNSPDYERISQIGEVVNYDSIKYKFLLCVSECHCSSHLAHMENHSETPQIFLQHGLCTNEIKKMLNVTSHNNFFIVTTAYYEHDQICGKDYTIDPEHVWLTGQPRYDFLKNAPKKKIVIALTWRAFLSGLSKEKLLVTKYYKTLTKLMSDEKLYDLVHSYGYELLIKLHPEMNSLIDYLPTNDRCKIYVDSYNKLFEEACIMITDYSSAIYDFAYIGKPVIYFQFDDGEYFENNPYLKNSGFDYKNDGVGPVAYNFEELCAEVEKLLNNKCVMEEMYQHRINNFFAFHDFSNSDRVYEKIKAIVENQ